MEQNKDLYLEALYFQYIDNRGADGVEIDGAYQELHRHLEGMPWTRQNDIQCSVNALCSVVERAAFLDGVRCGAQLVMELLA